MFIVQDFRLVHLANCYWKNTARSGRQHMHNCPVELGSQEHNGVITMGVQPLVI